MYPQVSTELSERIRIVRVLAIFFVVVIHLPEATNEMPAASSWFTGVRHFLVDLIGRSAVPILSAIAGYLACVSYRDGHYTSYVVKRIGSIGIPMLIWNAIVMVMAFAAVAARVQSTRAMSIVYEPVYDALLGLTKTPANPPLYFLRDILVLSFCFPPLLVAARRFPIGLLVVATILAAVKWPLPILLRPNTLLFFCIGLVCAVRNVDLKKIDRFAIPILVVVIFFWTALLVAGRFEIESSSGATLFFLNQFAAASGLWIASLYLLNNRFGSFVAKQEQYIFVVFLSHYPIFSVLGFAWKAKFGGYEYPTYLILFFLSFPIAMLSGAALWAMVQRSPTIKWLVSGKSSERKLPA